MTALAICFNICSIPQSELCGELGRVQCTIFCSVGFGAASARCTSLILVEFCQSTEQVASGSAARLRQFVRRRCTRHSEQIRGRRLARDGRASRAPCSAGRLATARRARRMRAAAGQVVRPAAARHRRQQRRASRRRRAESASVAGVGGRRARASQPLGPRPPLGSQDGTTRSCSCSCRRCCWRCRRWPTAAHKRKLVFLSQLDFRRQENERGDERGEEDSLESARGLQSPQSCAVQCSRRRGISISISIGKSGKSPVSY